MHSSVKLLNSLFLLLIHWLVLYFSFVNCEIRSRLVFINLYVNLGKFIPKYANPPS